MRLLNFPAIESSQKLEMGWVSRAENDKEEEIRPHAEGLLRTSLAKMKFVALHLHQWDREAKLEETQWGEMRGWTTWFSKASGVCIQKPTSQQR